MRRADRCAIEFRIHEAAPAQYRACRGQPPNLGTAAISPIELRVRSALDAPDLDHFTYMRDDHSGRIRERRFVWQRSPEKLGKAG
jgi:hypothetical protein